MQICRAAEEIKIQTDEMTGSSESTKKIDHVHSKSHRSSKGSNKHRPNSKQVDRSNRSLPDRKRQCLKCLKYHDPAKCPAYNQKCHKCGHLGHYAVACRSKSGKVRQVVADKEQSTESDDSETEFYIGTIKADIVNVNCERDIDIIDHTASTDTVISGDNKSETMSTQNIVDETENEHTDILSTEDNKQESTNAGVHNEETLTESEHTDILSTEDNEQESTNAEVHNEETLNKLCDEPGVHEQDPDNNDDELFVAAIDGEGLDDVTQSQWQLPLLTSGTYVTYTLDTGAMCNVLPQNVYNLLEKRPKLHKTKVKLSSYGGESIPVVGKVIARIQKGQNKSYPVQFIVVSAKANPIIGLKTCEQLNLIKRISMINNADPTIFDDFDDLFGDLGCLPRTYHINIDPNVKPVVHPPRRVPFALRHKLRAELDRMVSLGVIEKVDQPTDWVNSIVLIEKHNGDLRIRISTKQ